MLTFATPLHVCTHTQRPLWDVEWDPTSWGSDLAPSTRAQSPLAPHCPSARAALPPFRPQECISEPSDAQAHLPEKVSPHVPSGFCPGCYFSKTQRWKRCSPFQPWSQSSGRLLPGAGLRLARERDYLLVTEEAAEAFEGLHRAPKATRRVGGEAPSLCPHPPDASQHCPDRRSSQPCLNPQGGGLTP